MSRFGKIYFKVQFRFSFLVLLLRESKIRYNVMYISVFSVLLFYLYLTNFVHGDKSVFILLTQFFAITMIKNIP